MKRYGWLVWVVALFGLFVPAMVRAQGFLIVEDPVQVVASAAAGDYLPAAALSALDHSPRADARGNVQNPGGAGAVADCGPGGPGAGFAVLREHRQPAWRSRSSSRCPMTAPSTR